jgi:Gpi18-like mannosyltransferase
MTQAVARSRTIPHWLAVPLTAFLITRLVVFAAVYLSDIALPQIANEDKRDAVEVWNRWDTVWYVSIVEDGYAFTPGEKSSVAFFPLYPLLMAALRPLISGPVVAGLLISNLAFLAALILLYRLTESLLESRSTAGRTVFYLAAFPTAFFFSAAYTESLFLLLSVGAAYAAHQRRWGWATLCGILASATRSLGFLVWLIVVFEWLSSHGWTLSTARKPESWQTLRAALRTGWPVLLLICLIPLGLLAYMLYLALTFNDPVAFWSAQAAWGFESSNPLAVIIHDMERVARGELPYFTYLNILAFFAVLWLTIPIARRLGVGYALYTLLSVLVPMFSRTESLIRYILVLFPAFIIVGIWGRNRSLDMALRVIWLPFLALFTALFVKGVFIG